MKKYIYPFTFIACLVANTSYGVEVSAKPFGSVNAKVSATEPNIIHVKNDVIVNISAKAGAVIHEEQTTDGSAMFSTTETKPFSVLIETEKGFTFTLNASPSKNANSSSVVIHNLANKGSKNDEDSSLSYPLSMGSYSGLITHILTEIINNRIPDGFVDTWSRKYDVPDSLNSVLKVKAMEAWVGQNMRVVKLEVTNISNVELELNERYFWTKKVMAIQIDPNVSILRPNSRVFAYVILKEVE
ncbi:type-F conjugative transfer system secretin TraK [Glaesserella parasuis]|uniref:TraK domain-containing protein n=2 Tax=Glaesserella parasuis TaxID=738 RepID=UPI00094FBECB|nr:type-F conjugative transfer system secretin TraK [Glaesserella parasuis]MCT8760487.1 type-F conjugative transfer system secretin TraK [Glaesserella parasuis]MCT8766575.1 type-F conjugative transfer system secretin TraK [Glaesserella parasuis]MDG6261607.1 type-F conjugative transfer system secretin TraK [Glaesserella parasuis]MDG6280371.1 type-F conjugative transfer system secretin TraK [Glaesserella parasuis]MDG6307829.1 type-F conjugative transfer system secretin TraK [Glaesserella parasui